MIALHPRWILSVLFMFLSYAAQGQCSATGCITDVNNIAISGSHMLLVNADSGDEFIAGTDSTGIFKINLPAGTYNFRFEASGYKTLKGSIQFFDGDNSELGNIVMKPDNTISRPNHTAGHVVMGKVTDNADNPIEFSAVRFLSSDSTFVAGVATDSAGLFKATLPATGNYLMMVSALGYTPVTRAVTIDRDSLLTAPAILRNDDNMLGEVTVSAGHMTRVDGHLLITPEKILVKHATTGYQLLNNIMLPGMEVDPFDGVVKLYGHDVSLYINGQPADYRMVQNLRPKDVQKIEYHDAPTGRYATDFAAINFITREQTTGGYVTLDAQHTIGGYLDGKYNGFAKINNGNTSYYVFAGYNLKSAVADKVTKTEKFNLQTMTVDRTFDSSTGRNRDHGEYGQFTVNNSGSRRFISVSAGIVANRPASISQGVTAYASPLNVTQATLSHKHNRALSPKLSYFGQFGLREKDFLLTTLDASYSNSRHNYTYTSDGQEVFSDTRDKMLNLSAQLIYQMDLGHRNTLSVILMDVLKIASTDYLGTYGSQQHMCNSEALAFAEYTHRVSDRFRFSVRPGLSMVNLNLRGHERHNFYFPRFYTQLTYTPTRRQQVNLSLSVGNAMSSLASRTSAEQPIDLIMSRRGNPDLKDVKLYEANISYNIQAGRVNLGSLLAVNYYSDALTAAYIAENDRLIIDVLNGDFKKARFSPNATWRITDALRCEIGGELCHMSYSNKHARRHLNYAAANVSLLYMLGDFSFNLKGNTAGRNLNSEYCYLFTPANVQFSAAWTHGNWRVDAWIKSLSHQTLTRHIDTPSYQMRQLSHGRLCGMAKIAYTFGFGRKIQRENKKADTSINSNIL